MSSRARRTIVFVIALAVVVILDQLTKALMRDLLADGRSITVIPGVVDFHLIHNEGAAFGLGSGFAWLYVIIALAIVIGCILYVVLGRPHLPLAITLGVVAGGGIGNVIDRIATGGVTDFIMPTFIDFAVFNVADIAITCGFIVAVILFWVQETRRDRERAAAAADNEIPDTEETEP